MRAASLIIAGGASLIGLVFPFVFAAHATGFNQSVLMLMMAGIAGAFVYGAGFRPPGVWAWVVSPAVTWPVVIGSVGLLVAIR